MLLITSNNTSSAVHFYTAAYSPFIPLSGTAPLGGKWTVSTLTLISSRDLTSKNQRRCSVDPSPSKIILKEYLTSRQRGAAVANMYNFVVLLQSQGGFHSSDDTSSNLAIAQQQHSPVRLQLCAQLHYE